MSTSNPLTARQVHIIEGAMRLFSRYGVRRTTMNDIALEAEVARQTLYNAFANKDEVLRASVRLFTDSTCQHIKQDLKGASSIEDVVGVVVHHLAVVPWDMLARSNHAEDILEGLSGASSEEMAVAEERYRKLVQTAFKPYATEIRASSNTPVGLADFVVSSAFGLKHQARDRVHLLKLLGSLGYAVAGMVQRGESK